MSNYQKGFEIAVKNLGVAYQELATTITVFEDLNFQVNSGEVVAICGLSGVGKSTLVRTIAGLIEPRSGQVEINSEKVTKPISKAGYVTQDYSQTLFPWLSVEKNVALPFKGKSIAKEARSTRVREVLEEVGIQEFAQLYPWQLSGGMQQRVAIARALVVRPQLLILDEPFASLDVFIRFELEDLVSNLVQKHGTTTLLVTHDIEEAIYMADRILVLRGTPAEISRDIQVSISRPRDQRRTRSSPEFLNLRDQLYESIRQ